MGTMMGSLKGLLLWLSLSFVAGWFGAQFEPGTWYAELRKPEWTPPPFVFGPVWTVLYILMAVAAWLVWRRSGFSGASLALSLYLLQLVLNGIWSFLFFGLNRPGLAALELSVLLLVLMATILTFHAHSRMAALLLIPYLLWAGFALLLNISIWRLNYI
jgi:translocator protein